MGRVFQYRTAWGLALVGAIYGALLMALPYTTRGASLRGVLWVLSFWGMIVYAPPAWSAVTYRGYAPGRLLYGLMMWLASAAIWVNMTMAGTWRFAGQPYYLINNSVFDLWIVLSIAALGIAVWVPDLFGKDVPPQSKLISGAAFLAVAVFAIYLGLAQPDLRPLAELLRPVLDGGHDYPDPDGGGPTRCE